MKNKNASERFFNQRNSSRLTVVLAGFGVLLGIVLSQLVRIMLFDSDKYYEKAVALWERERSIKAPRGLIYDRNGVVIADNIPVYSISVIHNQIKEVDRVVSTLSDLLDIDEAKIRKKVEKYSVREKIKSNVDKETADRLRECKLDGVMIDEDYKRYYPYETLASKVIGFTGGDNQGIIGLEVQYDKYLMGKSGSINTLTNAKGIEIKNAMERRIEPVKGRNLYTTIDVNIQKYVEQEALNVLRRKNAKRVCIVSMNPQNGEIYAMADVPEYNLNKPFEMQTLDNNKDDSKESTLDDYNKMWRNFCINDTYEPGSTFKIITATSAFEEGVLKETDGFFCPGYKIVEDRKIRCHKVGGHGSQTFREGIMNSCNPVFMEVGARVGVENYYKWLEKLGLFERTGVDLPGEANSIFHKIENVHPVELATMSFGQSFQITPLQLLRAIAAVINGGDLVTPHFGLYVTDENNNIVEKLKFDKKEGVISDETSLLMRELLENVVSEGTGKRAYVEGFSIGGKTATSEKLPRSSKKYISSFVGFAPANNPRILTIILIDEPEGTYYGGTIAAPVVGGIYKNILPYIGIEKEIINVDKKNEEVMYYEDFVY